MGPNPLLVDGGKSALCTSSRPFVHFAHGMDDSELLAGISRLENPFEGPNSARFGRSAFITSACTSGFAKLDLHSSRHCRRSESTGVMPDPPAKALARRTGVPTQHTAKVRPDPFTNACKCKAQKARLPACLPGRPTSHPILQNPIIHSACPGEITSKEKQNIS